ncbi:serine hydrolase [Arsenophonus symbiont of Ornithomya chloropus]|uniref:serine hydrolase n=1 Tax=Arsenophonus symbiont of Ornithomya chloropus TaxID=634121 RepID=UPI0032B16586
MKYLFFLQFIRIMILNITIIFSIITFANIKTTSPNFIDLKHPDINAASYILMDYYSGKILSEKNADYRRSPASLTKLMTTYTIGKKIKTGQISMNDIVIIDKNSWINNQIFKGSSLMFLKHGDRVSVSQLMRGINLQSGNDACVAIAKYIAGDETNFIKLMNYNAKKLGLKNTHFLTVHGLDFNGQYSSAHDIALIAQALIREIPEYSIYKEKEFTFNNIRQLNRNTLLWNKNINVDGIKTGYTAAAGYNLAASAIQGNMRLISVLLGAHSSNIRNTESTKLLIWGFNNFETIKLFEKKIQLITLPILFGDKHQVSLGINKNFYITIPRGHSKDIKIHYKFNNNILRAPFKKNKIVGYIIVTLDKKIIEQRPLISLIEVNNGNIFNKIIDYFKLFYYFLCNYNI